MNVRGRRNGLPVTSSADPGSQFKTLHFTSKTNKTGSDDGRVEQEEDGGIGRPLLMLLALRVDSALYLRYKIERKNKNKKQNGHELLCALERELCDANRAGRPRLKSVSFTSRLNLHTAEISQDATTKSVSQSVTRLRFFMTPKSSSHCPPSPPHPPATPLFLLHETPTPSSCSNCSTGVGMCPPGETSSVGLHTSLNCLLCSDGKNWPARSPYFLL